MTIQRIDTVDIHSLTTDTMASGDFLAFSDESEDGDISNKITIDNFVSAIAGTGLGSTGITLTADASGATLTGSTDNQVVTVTGADAITGEANLTFDGNSLGVVTGSATAVPVTITGASGQSVNLMTIENSSNAAYVEFQSTGSIRLGTAGTRRIWVENVSGEDVAGKNLDLRAGKSTGDKDGGSITFHTAAAGSSGSGTNNHDEALRIDADGAIRFHKNTVRKIFVEEVSGTNTAGKHLDVRAGKGTGTGDGGSIRFYTSDSGSSGSSANSYSEVLRLWHDKWVDFKISTSDGSTLDTMSPAAYLPIKVGGTAYYVPMYQEM
tara:strand:- start:3536 stop:4504 length:969 start_codon:yes stop_codon:yes gene_type:complete